MVVGMFLHDKLFKAGRMSSIPDLLSPPPASKTACQDFHPSFAMFLVGLIKGYVLLSGKGRPIKFGIQAIVPSIANLFATQSWHLPGQMGPSHAIGRARYGHEDHGIFHGGPIGFAVVVIGDNGRQTRMILCNIQVITDAQCTFFLHGRTGAL